MFRRLIVILVAAVACLLPASESVSATASIAGGAYTYDATIEQRVDACTRALDLDSALARGAWEGVAGTTTVDAAPFTYDVPTISRAKAHDFDDAPASPARLGDAPEGSAPLSHLARGASTTPSTFSSATNTALRFGGHTADDLAAGAAAAGRGDLTAAGHALTKHGVGQRARSSAFPALSGNPANINLIAHGQIDDILATGNVVTRTHPNYGSIIEVWAPDGRGARWYADGRFFGFLEPGP